MVRPLGQCLTARRCNGWLRTLNGRFIDIENLEKSPSENSGPIWFHALRGVSIPRGRKKEESFWHLFAKSGFRQSPHAVLRRAKFVGLAPVNRRKPIAIEWKLRGKSTNPRDPAFLIARAQMVFPRILTASHGKSAPDCGTGVLSRAAGVGHSWFRTTAHTAEKRPSPAPLSDEVWFGG